MSAKILAFAGSTRTSSYNKMLVGNAAKIAQEHGANVTTIDLRDYPLPLYDGDLETESGVPENALAIRKMMVARDGILLSCPEYNSSISAVLKNTIDWISRPVPNEPSLAAFTGKTAALLATSPGSLGGLRGLVAVRSLLSNVGMIVIPKQYALGNAGKSFDENNILTNESALAGVTGVVEQLIHVTNNLISE